MQKHDPQDQAKQVKNMCIDRCAIRLTVTYNPLPCNQIYKQELDSTSCERDDLNRDRSHDLVLEIAQPSDTSSSKLFQASGNADADIDNCDRFDEAGDQASDQDSPRRVRAVLTPQQVLVQRRSAHPYDSSYCKPSIFLPPSLPSD